MGKKLLAGKKGIIFGALNEHSIAWQVALKCHEEGAKIVLTNVPIAIRFADTNTLAKKNKSQGRTCGRYQKGRSGKTSGGKHDTFWWSVRFCTT